MEKVLNNTDDHDIDDWIQKDFNKFREKICKSEPNSALNFGELIDLYITHAGENPKTNLPPQSTQEQLSAILQDFNKFETTLPPPPPSQANMESNNVPEIEVSELMVEEMEAKDANVCETENMINTPDDGAGSSSDTAAFYVKYGDLKCYGADDGITGFLDSLFGPAVYGFRPLKKRINLGVDENASTSNTRAKRKYRG